MSDGEPEDEWALPPQRSLQVVVTERIARAIRSGEIKPGERIVENQLAKRLGVSRAPLREALKTLEASRLLETRHSRGTYVAQVSRDQAQDMIAVRATLEGLAARFVAARRTPEMIETLTRLHTEIERTALSGETLAWRELDWQFHETICRFGGNDALLHAWRSISDLVRLFLHDHPDYEKRSNKVLRHHGIFLDALRNGDPDHADRVFRTIILKSGFDGLGVDLPEVLSSLLDPEVLALIA